MLETKDTFCDRNKKVDLKYELGVKQKNNQMAKNLYQKKRYSFAAVYRQIITLKQNDNSDKELI
ncbi:hypothetical protein LBMAG49_14910 [Planctomycetota bacterium]|nr:hypothetical protein LBMAG49_14910 [Planctomycetota bacterium]